MIFDVITIGSATRDAFIKSGDFHVGFDRRGENNKGLVLPLGAKLEIPKIYFSTGGGATNTAVTFARQRLRTACIAFVGADISGRTVAEDLRRERVFTGFLQTTERPTAYSILLEPPSGERTVLVYRGASGHMDAQGIPWSRLRTKWFYVSSLAGNLGFLSRIVGFARTHRIRIAYNPGGKELGQRRRLLSLLGGIDVLILNREEAARLTGMPYRNERAIFKKFRMASKGIHVMTDAHRGAWISSGKYLYQAGIYKEKRIADRTGAGDAFASGFVSGILQQTASGKLQLAALPQRAVAYAIQLGSANATAKVEGMGAKYGLLTRKEFEKQKRWKHLPIKIINLTAN